MPQGSRELARLGCVQQQGDNRGLTKLEVARPPGRYSWICGWEWHLLQLWKMLSLLFLLEISMSGSLVDCATEMLL